MSLLNQKTVKGQNRSFGILFSIVFLIISLYPLINGEKFQIWALFISLIFLLLAFKFPKTLNVPCHLWIKFGYLIGMITAPIFITIIYIVTIIPTSIVMRVLGKDLLKLKFDKNAKSYWRVRKEKMEPMRNQF